MMRVPRKVYGPYVRKDGRQHVILVYEGHTKKSPNRRTVSYPKYLMEIHLGRELDPHLETVDHIDEDFTNNALGNLRILERSEHSKQDVKRNVLLTCTCVECGAIFQRNPRSTNNSARRQRAGPFCSRSCSGRYGARVQGGGATLDPQSAVVAEKTTLKRLNAGVG